jgi:lysophospholipase-1
MYCAFLLRFDICSFDFKSNPKDDNFNPDEDEAGMLRSSRQINELISAEIDAGMNPNRIVLGGFSQGGAMSLLTGLTSERKLGGIVVLSAWLPLRKKIKSVSVAQMISFSV